MADGESRYIAIFDKVPGDLDSFRISRYKITACHCVRDGLNRVNVSFWSKWMQLVQTPSKPLSKLAARCSTGSTTSTRHLDPCGPSWKSGKPMAASKSQWPTQRWWDLVHEFSIQIVVNALKWISRIKPPFFGCFTWHLSSSYLLIIICSSLFWWAPVCCSLWGHHEHAGQDAKDASLQLTAGPTGWSFPSRLWYIHSPGQPQMAGFPLTGCHRMISDRGPPCFWRCRAVPWLWNDMDIPCCGHAVSPYYLDLCVPLHETIGAHWCWKHMIKCINIWCIYLYLNE